MLGEFWCPARIEYFPLLPTWHFLKRLATEALLSKIE
jgi:hypothetical protein